ncbi:MAG TPA: type VI secretion system-associated protein TagF [Ignavibacteriaceae bacterium]|nr:type VI secretion system-associated protein TagF [Ignavibacteriaceae bacterium]
MNAIDDHILTAGFFGKLPKFADFVKFNASGSEISILDYWLQEGLALAKLKFRNEWKNYYENTSEINFIYPFTGTDKIMLGIICPSNDKSGRSFPFILFGNVKKDFTNELPVQSFALKFSGVYESFKSIFQNNFQNDDLSKMKSQLSNFSFASSLQNSNSELYREYLSKNSIEYFFDLQMDNLHEPDKCSLNNLINKNLSYLENSAAVRISFESDEQNEIMNLSFCTELMLKIFSRYSLFPALFWKRRKDNYVVLYLFFQKPTPSNFIDLIYSEQSELKNNDDNFSRKPDSIFKETAMVDINISLADLLVSIKDNLN